MIDLLIYTLAYVHICSIIYAYAFIINLTDIVIDFTHDIVLLGYKLFKNNLIPYRDIAVFSLNIECSSDGNFF